MKMSYKLHLIIHPPTDIYFNSSKNVCMNYF